MDFNDTPEQAEFRAEARAWLASTAPAYEKPDGTAVGVFSSTDGLDIAKDWQACKADAGRAALHWPVEHPGSSGRHPASIEQFPSRRSRAAVVSLGSEVGRR